MTKRFLSRKKAFNLIEVLIAISIFTIISLVIGNLIGTFADVYVRTQNQMDLIRLQRTLAQELSIGDEKYFDGLRSAPEIIEANDGEIHFVPMYRQSSEPAGYYTTHGIFNTQEQEGGAPPQQDGTFPGGLRIQYNEFSQKYELRMYLSKHPRAGSGSPEVLIRYDNDIFEPATTVLKEALGSSSDLEFQSTIAKYQSIPVKMNWVPPLDFSKTTPGSYIVFTGGNFPLEFEGTAELPPSASEVTQTMAQNEGQLFPDPFNRPGDRIIMYYHPETDPGLIENQESLMAHLFFKNFYPDAPSRFNFDTGTTQRWNDTSVNGIHDNSLLLYYDNRLSILPTDASFNNRNFEASRVQFLKEDLIPKDLEISPTKFSYYSSRNTTQELPMSQQEGRFMVESDYHLNISLLGLDLLAIIGADIKAFKFEEISKRFFRQIIPFESLHYTHHIHTNANGFGRTQLGFQESNCQPGPPGRKCRKISRNFPSGDKVRLSQSFFISNIDIDSNVSTNITGKMRFVFKNLVNQRVYLVQVDFDQSKVYIMKKLNYAQEDVPFDGTNPDVMEFPLDNSQFINFTNLQSSGFLDEGFNYSSPEVYIDHLVEPDSLEFTIEIDQASNIEGFSLTYLPK